MSSIPDSSADTHPSPPRVMGFRDLVLFYVVSGVSLRWIATAAMHGPSSLVIWFGGWLFLYIPLALSVIELSSRYPEEGGFYVWTKKAFGDGAAFLSAWTYWVSNLPFFPTVLYFAASNILFLHPALQRFSARPSYFITFSVFMLIGLTILNILGLNLAKWAHNIGALAMWIPALIIIVLGFAAWKHFGSATSLTPSSFIPSARPQDMIFWSVVIFSFIGCEAASLMAGEIKDARRNIPPALLLAGLTITVCYILGTLCVLLALPSSESSNLEGLPRAIARTCSRLHLPGIPQFAGIFIVISNIGAAGAFFAAMARLPFVAGIDGYLPRALGQLHPRWKTPWISLLGQGLFSMCFVFLGQAGTSVRGAYEVLAQITVFISMVPFLFLFASMIRLQRDFQHQDAEKESSSRIVRVPGGRRVAVFLGGVGLAASSFAIALSLIPPPEEPHKFLFLAKTIGANAFLIALGLLLFFQGRRRARKASV